MLRYFRENSEDMKELKLISVLKTFTKEEIKEFEKFINSPFHNNGRNYKSLYSYLKKLHPEFPPQKITEDKIFKKLYPHKKYDPKASSLSIRVILSQLTKLTEEYLMIRYFRTSNEFKFVSLIKEYSGRKLFKLCDSYIKMISKDEDKNSDDSSYFLQQHMIKRALFNLIYEKKSNNLKKYNDARIELTESALYLFLFELINHKEDVEMLYSEDFRESDLIMDVMGKIDINNLLGKAIEGNKMPALKIMLLYYFNRIVTDFTDEKAFLSLKKILLDNLDVLSFDSKKSYLAGLCNFCLYEKLNKRVHYLTEFKKLYTLLLNESIKEGNYEQFDVRQYRNIIRMYAHERKFFEITEYNEKYLKYHNEVHREDCFNYSRAITAFQQNRFEECLRMISKSRFSIPMMIRDLKYIKIQCLIELEHYDLFYSEMDSFQHFLRNSSEIPKEFIETDKVVLKHFLNFMRYKEKNLSTSKDHLYNIISSLNSENIYLKWLLGKLI